MSKFPTRRSMLKFEALLPLRPPLSPNLQWAKARRAPLQRVVVVMFDGFDPRYLAASNMPVLGQWKLRHQIYKQVKGVMPSVTIAE